MRPSTFLSLTILFGLSPVLPATATDVALHPDPRRSLSDRFEWAESQPGPGGFWVGYSFDRWLPADSYLVSGDWIWGRNPGVPLAEVLAGRPAAAESRENRDGKVRRSLAILLGYPAGASTPDAVAAVTWNVPVDWKGRPLRWLGNAAVEESLERLTGLYRDDQPVKLQEDLIEAVGLHDLDGAVGFLESVLGSQASAKARAEAAESLAWQTGPRAVKLLARAAVDDRSIDVRVEAVEALGEIEAGAAVQALVDIVRKTDADVAVREEAVEALAERGTAEAVATLEELLWKDASARIHEEALDALADLPHERALPILTEVARKHPSADLREEAVERLAEMAGERAVDVLEEVATRDRSFAVRSEALEILGELPGGAGLPLVIKIARTHPDQALRAEALDVLADSDDPRARRALARWAAE